MAQTVVAAATRLSYALAGSSTAAAASPVQARPSQWHP
ncbi:hypothetical protein AVHM3334_22560 [Acidovorax sp. SUPP3334]|nr:hypothetical protein AVHM3334_22560 [Acidovorax sp. SUPP3334]